jgi:uncharacterized membrane protein
MPAPVLIALFVLYPAVAIYLCYRFPVLNKVGVVIFCYVAGIALGNAGVLQAGADQWQKLASDVAVAVALPLLFFSIDVKKWSRLAGKSLLCMLLATIAIVVVAFGAFFIIRGHVPGDWKLVGMAIGVYTGGTPNLAAIRTALGVDNDTYIMMHTYDTVISLIYIIFCTTVAQRIFGLFLPKFDWTAYGDRGGAETAETEDIQAYRGVFRPRTLLKLLGALALSGAIVAASDSFGALFPEAYVTMVVILAITTLGIACSFVPFVRRIEKTFQLGMYVIYVFCFVVGSMTSVETLININWSLMLFVIVCIFASMALHALLCRLFEIDTDTFIITSVSAICSPPFVPPVAAGLKNRAVLLSGVITGIIGYAIGNYLGISMAYLLRYLIE